MNNSLGLFRIGILYMSYRLVVAGILFLICIIDFVSTAYYELGFYLGFVFTYLVLAIFQFLFYVQRGGGKTNLAISGWVDISSFAIFNYAFSHLGIHVTFLYIVTLFILSLVQEKKVTALLTLTAVIFVSYFSFFDSWWSGPDGVNFLNALILTVLFLSVSTLGVMFASRYKYLEAANQKSVTQLEGFREISNRVMEQIDTGYMVITQDNKLVMINPSAQLVFNLPMAKGVVVTDYVDGLKELIFKHVKHGINRFSETLSINNKEYFVSYRMLSPGDVESFCLVTVENMSDISNRVRYLKLAALGQLSASIAHEIRNPLTSIYQANALMDGASPERMSRYSEIITLQCDRINKIVESTLNMAKNQEFNPSPIKIGVHLRELVGSDLVNDASKIQILVDDDHMVLFDEGHFKQVIQNLINNALRHNDFSKSGQIEITSEINDDTININVIDYGQGVEDRYVSNLFDAFFTTEMDGTGLGLHLCKNLCETNHAKILYNNIDGRTCFQVQCQKYQLDVV